jgi:hypothetical protein
MKSDRTGWWVHVVTVTCRVKEARSILYDSIYLFSICSKLKIFYSLGKSKGQISEADNKE